MIRIATFFTHFGAVCCKRACDRAGISARMMPVPRALSSSCGTCVCYEGELLYPAETIPEEVEQIVEVHGEEYRTVYRAEE